MANLQVARREDKYLLTAAQAVVCQARIASLLKADPHNGPQGYLVRSLYFDTVGQRDFLAQQNGERIRRKIRLRIYGEDDTVVKLECKAKDGDHQKKLSYLLTREEAARISRGDISPLKLDDSTGGYFRSFFLQGYRPSVLVQYRRSAYTLPVGNIRVTFDRLVECRMVDLDLFSEDSPWTPVLPAGQTVLEVKYSGELPRSLRTALAPWIRQRNSYSKFGLSHVL